MTGLPPYPMRNPSHFTSPTPMVKPKATHAPGKENTDPRSMTSQAHVFNRPTYNNLSPVSKRRWEDDSILSHPLVAASHIYPPPFFWHDPAFNPLYSPYLSNAFQTNGYQPMSYARALPRQPAQPSYNEDFKPNSGFNSTFQGNFKELDNPVNPYHLHSPLAHEELGFANHAAASPFSNSRNVDGFANDAGTSPTNGLYMGI